MIDSISVYSPYISAELAEELKSVMLKKQAIYNGQVVYEFNNIIYQNSYSSNINIQLCNTKWIYDEVRELTVKVDTDWYIKIDGSLHKFFLGHNCFGGSDNLYRMFHEFLRKIKLDLRLMHDLPVWHKWIITRIDYARVYKVGTQQNVLDYFYGLRNVTYPRKNVIIYPGESIYKGGRTTAIKLYNKYVEFKKHDYKIWKKYNPWKAEEILNYAEDIIRIEVEVKNPKIKYDYGRELTVKELRMSYLEKIFKTEIYRLLNEGEEMKNLKGNYQVRVYLQNRCSESEFKVLYAFYNDLSLNGKDIVRKTTSKSTFYRNLKRLRELGVNYINNDIVKDNVSFNFNPLKYKHDKLDLIAV